MKKTLCFVAVGAFGLGYIINALQTAHALPNTSSIHLTANPVRSYGGTVQSGNPITVFNGASDSDFLIKDFILSKNGSSTGDCSGTVYLTTSTGTNIGEFIISSSVDGNSGWGASTISHQFASGLSVPVGEDLLIDGSYSCGTIAYTIAGMFVHP